jgi:hypothetical protein
VRKFRRCRAYTQLSCSERRALRRLEDAAVAEDPLLDVRLGLALSRSKRSVAKWRRRLKAFGRYILGLAPVVVLGIGSVILAAPSFILTHSVVCALLVFCAFALGVALGDRHRLRASSVKASSFPSIGTHA